MGTLFAKIIHAVDFNSNTDMIKKIKITLQELVADFPPFYKLKLDWKLQIAFIYFQELQLVMRHTDLFFCYCMKHAIRFIGL